MYAKKNKSLIINKNIVFNFMKNIYENNLEIYNY